MTNQPQRKNTGSKKVLRVQNAKRIELGQHWSYNILDDPKRLAFVLSRYAFAARMAAKNRNVLELGCSEGLGGIILAEYATHYTGVDSDSEAIEAAKRNWNDPKFTFIEDDFLGKQYGQFDSVISLDVIEHIEAQYETVFLKTLCNNLRPDGLCVIGTPNVTASAYASAVSRTNHVNLYDARRLVSVLEQHFRKVLFFGMNDEVVHTGFPPMAHYLMAIGCVKKI